ncbi:hypothetical protein R1sor_012003 [Riccia sorocarpa]|uniref:Uncharacterized protein n=1 Tax=Riccia sorocarpa TaxID=122646 RepID=A0ABD3I595_9MARC
MAFFFRKKKRKGKGKLSDLPEEPEEDRTTQCGYGGSRNCFIVGVRDPEHTKTLATHDVVFYGAKRMLSIDRWGISGRERHDTERERSAYDDEMFAEGFLTGASLPHDVHGLRLREALDSMTTVNISNRTDHRRTAVYWATFFQELEKDKL